MLGAPFNRNQKGVGMFGISLCLCRLPLAEDGHVFRMRLLLCLPQSLPHRGQQSTYAWGRLFFHGTFCFHPRVSSGRSRKLSVSGRNPDPSLPLMHTVVPRSALVPSWIISLCCLSLSISTRSLRLSILRLWPPLCSLYLLFWLHLLPAPVYWNHFTESSRFCSRSSAYFPLSSTFF